MKSLGHRLWHMPIVLFTGALMCWSGNAVFTRLTIVSVDVGPIQLSFWRTIIGFAIITAIAWPQLRRDWAKVWQNWLVLAFLGISSLVAYNLLLYFGLASGEEAPAASTISSLFPLVIVAISVLFFGERVTRLGWLGIALAVFGGLVAAFEGSIDKVLSFELSRGKIWLVGAVIGYGTYMACLRLRPKGLGQFSFLWALVFWALVFLTLLWIWDSTMRGNSFPWHEPGALANLAFIAIGPMLVAPIFVNQAIKVGGAQTPGLMMNALPFMVAAMAMLTPLRETLQWYHWVSLALIVPGVVLIQLKK